MKLDSVIFCEDIRNEMFNKKTLVGLYSDRIVIRTNSPEKITMPFPIRLACFCRFLTEQDDPYVDTFEFSFLLPDKTGPVAKGPIKINPNHRYFTIAITGEGLPVQIGNLGYKIILKHGDEIIKEFTQEDALLVQFGPIEQSSPPPNA